jgi:hypothetical protein
MSSFEVEDGLQVSATYEILRLLEASDLPIVSRTSFDVVDFIMPFYIFLCIVML